MVQQLDLSKLEIQSGSLPLLQRHGQHLMLLCYIHSTEMKFKGQKVSKANEIVLLSSKKRLKYLANYCLVLLQVPKCFGLVQIFCARSKIEFHLVPILKLNFIKANHILVWHKKFDVKNFLKT